MQSYYIFRRKHLFDIVFFDCMAEREQQNSPYTIIYMADEVRISAFYSFKRLFSSLFFMERSGSLMKRRLAKIKRRKNYFKRRSKKFFRRFNFPKRRFGNDFLRFALGR